MYGIFKLCSYLFLNTVLHIDLHILAYTVFYTNHPMCHRPKPATHQTLFISRYKLANYVARQLQNTCIDRQESWRIVYDIGWFLSANNINKALNQSERCTCSISLEKIEHVPFEWEKRPTEKLADLAWHTTDKNWLTSADTIGWQYWQIKIVLCVTGLTCAKATTCRTNHGGRLANAFTCNARGDRFALQLWRHCRE